MRSALHADLSRHQAGRQITDGSLSSLLPARPERCSWTRKPSCSIPSPPRVVLRVLTSATTPHAVTDSCHPNTDPQILPGPRPTGMKPRSFAPRNPPKAQPFLHAHAVTSDELDPDSHGQLLSLTNAISSFNTRLLACPLEHLTFHRLPLCSTKPELLVAICKALPSTPALPLSPSFAVARSNSISRADLRKSPLY